MLTADAARAVTAAARHRPPTPGEALAAARWLADATGADAGSVVRDLDDAARAGRLTLAPEGEGGAVVLTPDHDGRLAWVAATAGRTPGFDRRLAYANLCGGKGVAPSESEVTAEVVRRHVRRALKWDRQLRRRDGEWAPPAPPLDEGTVAAVARRAVAGAGVEKECRGR